MTFTGAIVSAAIQAVHFQPGEQLLLLFGRTLYCCNCIKTRAWRSHQPAFNAATVVSRKGMWAEESAKHSGRLQSVQAAAFDRNPRPTSSECAILGAIVLGLPDFERGLLLIHVLPAWLE